MGFKIYQTDDGRSMPLEYQPCGAITPKVGMALVMTGGKLVLASGAVKPQYISMREQDTPCQDGDRIPVVRVGSDVIFETTAAAAMTAVKPGERVTIHTDGMQVTATKTDGVAEVVYLEDTAAGSRVHVRF